MKNSNKKENTIITVSLEKEMSKNYLNYAMSVIMSRALPDVRDGLKPVHRRVLYTMYKINNIFNKPFIKCARVVGEVMGKYHPHGDNSIYEALVRMAQNFSLRYPLIEGQGNFGSIDGDSAAAMRYTECRLKKISNEILKDIKKNTVDFISNYDGKEKEPLILPSKIPNLLINGSSGIAVGLATNIPPHNIIEIINGTLYLLKNKNCSIEELIKIIPAPDMPTGGIIYGTSGIEKAYKTGKGLMILRAKIHFEKYNNKNIIIIDEIPYQVNKKNLIEKIIELIQNKKIENINNLRDESDKSGIRIVIELKNNASLDYTVYLLYKYTQLQETFGINLVALVNKRPKLLNLKKILKYFILHRKEIITRKTKFKINKAKKKKHLLKGLAIAIENIKTFINIITTSKKLKEVKKKILNKHWYSKINFSNKKKIINKTYLLTKKQIKKILQIKLQKLTTFEKEKIIYKYKKIKEKIINLTKILNKQTILEEIIYKELIKIKENFLKKKDKRLSKIETNIEKLTIKDFFIPKKIIITLSYLGNIKYKLLSNEKTNNKNKHIINIEKNDWIIQTLIININDNIFYFTNKGKLYIIKKIKIKKNKINIKNKIFNLKENEKIIKILSISKEKQKLSKNKYIFLSTNFGIIKKISLSIFNNIKKNGIIIIELKKNDFLIEAIFTNGKNDIILITNFGILIRFKEENIKSSNRLNKGINGINLKKNQIIITLLKIKNNNQIILIITENGFGKKILIKEYIQHKRGTKGITTIKINNKNGKIINAFLVKEKDKIILITNKNKIFKIETSKISISQRLNQGIKLISLKKDNKLIGIQKIS